MELSSPRTPFPELFSGPEAPGTEGARRGLQHLGRNPGDSVFVAAENIVWWYRSLLVCAVIKDKNSLY